MSLGLLLVLLGLTVLGSGLVAGIFVAFSTFIMPALARVDTAHGISAMQSINSTILGSLFMPLFFGSTLTAVLLAGLALADWRGPVSLTMLTGGFVYLAGMFFCTILRNVPLNRQLAGVQPGQAEAVETWARYLKQWTFWNHVRSLASLLACALFLFALQGL